MKTKFTSLVSAALLSISVLCGHRSMSQTVASYGFTQSAGTYTPITGGTVMGTTTSDDQVFVDASVPAGAASGTTGVGLPIGFNFTYNGTVYDRFAINNNGWIVFGQSSLSPSVNTNSSSGYTAISSTSTAAGILQQRVASLSRDLQAQAGAEIRFQTIGTSPNQTLVVQWSNYRKYAATGDNFNFQIRLNEGSNIVEVVYGVMTSNATSTTVQVGLRGMSNADYNNRTSTTSWSASAAGAVNTANMTLSSTVFPVSGQTYTWTPPSPCSGTPTAGTTMSSAPSACNGVNFTLSLSGIPAESGLTYQWQSSPDGITYANIAGATNSTLVTSQTASTYYQAVITCSTSGLSSTSAPLQVTMNPFYNCYCTATNSGSACITNVTLNTLNNTTAGCSTGNYSAQSATTTLSAAASYSFSITTNATAITSVWFDWNQNGVFEASEWYQGYTTGTTGTIVITVPVTALTGTTGMRVRSRSSGNTNGSGDACTNMGSGETEDYLINITPAVPCSGSPTPGATQSTAASVCSGTSFTLSMSTPPSGLSGITYQWQSSADGTSYTNISGATNAIYTTTQTANTYYQVVVTCTNSASTATSTPLQVTMEPFVNCYCSSTATSTSDEDIFNVTIGTLNNSSTCTTTGGAGSVQSLYSDYTSIAAPNLSLGTTNPFSVEIGTCGSNWTNSTRIFIDYNQNGLFTDAGETVYTSTAGTAGPHIESGNISIPVSALTGNTRMRIITVETGTPTSITPCGTYTWGETEDYLVNIVPLPSNPPTPVQDPSTPSCATGTDLSVPGSPAAGEAWYWQTSASGTSLSNPVSGLYTVYYNGIYYVRTYNATYNTWSASSSSVTVSNIPLAPLPPVPTAAASPACLNTTISMSAPPPGTGFFWQGTNNAGVSNAQNASTPFSVTATGTYYVSAYDSATSCWSNTNGVFVTIDSYVPSFPVASVNPVAVCQGSSSAFLNASAPASDSVIVSFGTNLQSPGTAVTYNVTVPAIPAGATITNTQLLVDSAYSISSSFRSEIRVALSGATTLAATQISTQSSSGLVTPDPVITVPNLPLAGGVVTLTLTETYNDGGTAIDATFGEVRLIIRYTLPASTVNWWDASTAGSLLGSGNPFESVGSSVLPNTNTPGTYTFFAQANSGSCSSSRIPVDVQVNPLPSMVLNDTAICAGTTYSLNAQNAGSTYIWNTAATSQSISVSSAGLYYVDITTAAGCSRRDSVNIQINNLPLVDLGADIGFCTGDSILLDAGNTGFDFSWNDMSTNQTLTANTGGNYFVTVTNPATQCSASDTIVVTVNPLPLVNLGNDTAFCSGDSIVLDAGNPGALYSWNNSSTNQTITVNSPATYFVFVSNTTTGCYKSDTIIVSQNSLPVVNIGSDTAICSGSTLTLNAGFPGSSYLWNDSSSAQTLNVTAAGNYSVQLVDMNGCKGSDSINVSLNALPVVNLGSDTTQCAGTVLLDAGNAGFSFMWNNSSTGQTLTASVSGTYYVSVTDANVCTATDSVNVTINPLPVVDLGNDTTQCGGSITLDAGNPGFNYLWYNNTNAQTLTVYSTGSVSVMVTNPSTGCIASDTVVLTFNQYPVVNLGSDTAQCAGTVTLNAGNFGASYVWNTSATTSTITVNSSGLYYVNVSNNGCTSSDSIMVTINTLPLISFPPMATLCLQSAPVLLNASPSGGIFSGGASVTGNSFDPAIAGAGAHSVQYTYTDANSCSNSFTQTINVNDCIGIEETENVASVNVYPNPSNGMFSLSFTNVNFETLTVSITDIQGKEVFKSSDKNISGDYNKQIDLEGLSKGIYYIIFNADAEIITKKLIIN